jgi:hypothetical protein
VKDETGAAASCSVADTTDALLSGLPDACLLTEDVDL